MTQEQKKADDVIFGGDSEEKQEVDQSSDKEERQNKQQKEKEEQSDGTQYPVLSNSDDQGAWINTDKNGNEYLSVKKEDGEYINLFPQTDLMKDALKRQHEVQKQ